MHLQNAIEKGVAKAAAEEAGDEAAALDTALVNVALMLGESVKGRVAIEVDPRLASDSGAWLGLSGCPLHERLAAPFAAAPRVRHAAGPGA